MLGVAGNANLFLINPNGILFGPTARLDLRGSFFASTASSVDFSDGTQFSATNPDPSALLTVNVPLGLQLGEGAGGITVQGSTLTVQPGSTLALIGGEIAIAGGFLSAAGAQVELGSVGSGEQVTLTPLNQGWALNYEGAATFRDVQLTNEAFVNASGAGGAIQVRGRRVTLQDGAQIAVNTLGPELGGNLAVTASEAIELIGTSSGFPSGLFAIATATANAIGVGGTLTVDTEQLIVQEGAQIAASTQGAGRAGNLFVRAVSVELSGTDPAGFPSGLFATVTPDASGAGGNLTIEAEQLIVRAGAQVSVATFDEGDAGNLTIRATDVELIGVASQLSAAGLPFPSGLFAGADLDSTGEGGDLIIETRHLLIRDGAQAQASTLGAGDAGNLFVRASESVTLVGTALDRQLSSRLLAVSGLEGVTTQATGQGGNLSLETGELLIQDGAGITVSSANPTSEANGAGNLQLTARTIRLEDQATITAETASGDGGNLILDAQESLILRRNSTISTTSGTAQAGGNGGDISINTPFLIAVPSEDSDITANAFTGSGGNIKIGVQGIFGIQFRENETPESDITASSTFGIDGNVEINGPDVDPSQGLTELPSDLVDAAGLLDRSCAASAQTPQSSFTVTGRGGLPANPGEVLDREQLLEDLGPALVSTRPPLEKQAVTPTPPSFLPDPIVEAQGWIVAPDGTVVLTAQAPNVTPQPVWLARPSC